MSPMRSGVWLSRLLVMKSGAPSSLSMVVDGPSEQTGSSDLGLAGRNKGAPLGSTTGEGSLGSEYSAIFLPNPFSWSMATEVNEDVSP